jgi:hypothetical protein
MKLDKRNKTTGTKGAKVTSKTNINSHKKSFLILICAVIAVAAIVWVMLLGRKAEATVTVCMSAKDLYKNEQITDLNTQVKAYDMAEIEYLKYTVDSSNSEYRRIVTWDEVNYLLGYYMAYYVPIEHVLEYDMFVASKIENSDTVLYAYPGKEIVSLQLGTSDLSAFKAFLTTGDRINIECTYTESVRVYAEGSDEYSSNKEYEDVEQFYTVPVFTNIQIADILNSDGDSVLDIQAEYNDLTIFEQAELDEDSNYQKKLEPSTILLALTPQEKREYYKYLSKGGTFRMSLPQRTE